MCEKRPYFGNFTLVVILLSSLSCGRNAAPDSPWVQSKVLAHECLGDSVLSFCKVDPPKPFAPSSLAISGGKAYVLDTGNGQKLWQVSTPVDKDSNDFNVKSVKWHEIALPQLDTGRFVVTLAGTTKNLFIGVSDASRTLDLPDHRPFTDIYRRSEPDGIWELDKHFSGKDCDQLLATDTDLYAFCFPNLGHSGEIRVLHDTTNEWEAFSSDKFQASPDAYFLTTNGIFMVQYHTVPEQDVGTTNSLAAAYAFGSGKSVPSFRKFDTATSRWSESTTIEGESLDVKSGSILGSAVISGQLGRESGEQLQTYVKRQYLELATDLGSVLKRSGGDSRWVPLSPPDSLRNPPAEHVFPLLPALLREQPCLGEDSTRSFLGRFDFTDVQGALGKCRNQYRSLVEWQGKLVEVSTDAILHWKDIGAPNWENADELLPSQERPQSTQVGNTDDICTVGSRLVAVVNKRIYISASPSEILQPWGDGLEGNGSEPLLSLICGDNEVVSRNGYGLFYRNVNDNAWRKLPDGPLSTQLPQSTMLSKNVLYGFAYDQVYRLSFSDGAWIRVGELPRMLTLWVDERNPRLIIAATSKGFAWSNDGGRTFHSVSVPAPLNSNDRSVEFKILGNDLWFKKDVYSGEGWYFVRDRIPAPLLIEDVVSFLAAVIRGNLKLCVFLAGIVCLFAIGSTRLILVILSWDIPLLRETADIFYATRFGRWRLARTYLPALLRRDEIRESVEHYVEITTIVLDGDRNANDWRHSKVPTITESVLYLQDNENVVLTGPGGSGKSTLCNHIAAEVAMKKLQARRKFRVPVVVHGISFKGQLAESIEQSLRRNNACVNYRIVECLLQLGLLFVIFDGYSEIPGSVDSGDLASVVSRFPDSVYFISSRTPLDPALYDALGRVKAISFAPLSDSGEREILACYLAQKDKGVVAHVQEEFDRIFSDLRFPLMLKLAAEFFNKNSAVPSTKNELFENYAKQLLSAEKLGLEDSRGIQIAVEYLVLHTFIESGGGERSIDELTAVQLILEILPMLEEGYGLKLKPLKVVDALTRSGLLRVDGKYRFFHDSFQSYYAARALNREIQGASLRVSGNVRHDCKLRSTFPEGLVSTVKGNPRLAEAIEFLEGLQKLDE